MRLSAVFLDAYAPWCPHCQSLAPVWNSLAGQLKGRGVAVARMNADAAENSAMADKLGVQSYPTLLMFRNGVGPVEYTGERSLEAMTNFALQYTSSSRFREQSQSASKAVAVQRQRSCPRSHPA